MGKYNKNDPYYNSEKYLDTTAGKALSKIYTEEKAYKKKLDNMQFDREDSIFDYCFEELLKDGAIYSEIGDITFELTNAVLGGYPDKAIQKLDEAKRKGEPTLRICSILYEGFRNLVAYTGLGKDKQNAGVRTGLTDWQIKQCIDLSGGYNMKELIRNMLLCQRVESGVKTGTIEEDTVLEYLVLHCLH